MEAVSLRQNTLHPGKLFKFLSPGMTVKLGQPRGLAVSVTTEEQEKGVEIQFR